MNRNQTPKVIMLTAPNDFVAAINQVMMPDSKEKVAIAEYFHESSYLSYLRRKAVLTLNT